MDQKLVLAALKNPDDYSQIVKKYEKPIFSYIMRISGVSYQEAEDIAQEIFLKAYTNLNDYDQRRKFSTWLFSIAHNETISHWRKNKKRLKDVDIEDDVWQNILTDEQFDIEKKIDDKSLGEEVKKAIQKLDIKYRGVLQLKYYDDLSYEEISDIIKKPVNTVGTLLNRAKKKLEKILYDSDFRKN